MYGSGAKQYQSVSNQTSVMDADPHKLIQLLIDAGLTRMAQARGHIERGEIEQRNLAINKAIGIVGGLQDSLDMETGELAENLDRLYDYMQRRLFQANVENSTDMIDEVSALLSEIKSAWDAIRDEALAGMSGQSAAL